MKGKTLIPSDFSKLMEARARPLFLARMHGPDILTPEQIPQTQTQSWLPPGMAVSGTNQDLHDYCLSDEIDLPKGMVLMFNLGDVPTLTPAQAHLELKRAYREALADKLQAMVDELRREITVE